MINYKNIFFLLCLFAAKALAVEPIRFVMIVPSYNNEKWCIQNIRSCVNQKYPHWILFYINDCSTDNTGRIVEKYIRDRNLQDKCHIIHNHERKGALRNLYEIIRKCKSTDVIVTIDGDDMLSHDQVLDTVSKAYATGTTWITYGNYMKYPSYEPGRCKDLPKKIQEKRKFRSYKWITSHLRTFYAGLFHKIDKEDLKWNGKFYPTTWDLAMMFPMLEMASQGHITYINQILYLYNTQNPISDNKAHRELQQMLDNQIRSKNKYKPLDKLFKTKG